MFLLKRYRTCAAVFLLALYAFVAAPIQLWHYHGYSTTASSYNKEITSLSESNGKSAEGNCQLCSHHYSTYNAGTFVISAVLLFDDIVNEGFYYNFIPSALLFNFANKGPPVLA